MKLIERCAWVVIGGGLVAGVAAFAPEDAAVDTPAAQAATAVGALRFESQRVLGRSKFLNGGGPRTVLLDSVIAAGADIEVFDRTGKRIVAIRGMERTVDKSFGETVGTTQVTPRELEVEAPILVTTKGVGQGRADVSMFWREIE